MYAKISDDEAMDIQPTNQDDSEDEIRGPKQSSKGLELFSFID